MKLYKYVSVDLWKNILDHKLIRFTQPAVFNDPFEMQPFYESITGGASLEQIVNGLGQRTFDDLLAESYSNLDDSLKAFASLDMVRSISSPAFEAIANLLENFTPMAKEQMSKGINQHIGVLSLTKKHDNLLMWAHYAQNHRGFVIEFNAEHEYFNQQRTNSDECGHLREVQYSEKRPSIVLMDMDSTQIFLVKSKDWAYEEEYRMLRPLKDCDDTLIVDGEPIYLFSFPPECMTGLIFGSRMPIEQRKQITALIASEQCYSHVRVYEALLDEKEFKLNIVQNEI